jgi:2-methylfumaryl-CoA isomerase
MAFKCCDNKTSDILKLPSSWRINMYDVLSGMRILELSAFIAAPLAGLTLSQLGADVIRVDPEGGGMDYKRWPLSDDNTSLYWAGLNKGKRSVALDLKHESGRDTFREILASSCEDGGILLTNLTGPTWLSYDELCKVRPDLIMVSLTGHNDGKAAVDYTVNCAVGIPMATGYATPEKPVNNMLPAWDAIAGMTLALAILTAERHRRKTGEGQHVTLALSDVAYALVSNLGYTSEAEALRRDRPAIGNHMYGALGHNLPTLDGRQLMFVVLTERHWLTLVNVSNTCHAMAEIEYNRGVDLNSDAGRYEAKDDIILELAKWSNTLTLSEIGPIFDEARILWGPYQTFQQMVQEDPRASLNNPMFQEIEQEGVGRVRATGSPLNFIGKARQTIRPAMRVGADTNDVLKDVLGQ